MASTIIGNGYMEGFAKGTIYRGKLKSVCFPGLNCYSCPGAYTSCPIGSLQSVAAGLKHQVSLYVIGFLMLVGTIGGRLVCGWLCPFGFFQELLYKIPSKKFKMPKILNKVKYFFLVVFVLLLPAFFTNEVGIGLPYFCKYICPAGTLEAGIPLTIKNAALRGAIGIMYYWKLMLLTVTIIFSILISRPFCRAVCPLGAIYSLFNSVSFYRMSVDGTKCTKCNVCNKNCPVDIKIYENANSPECVRCGKCVDRCPTKAIKSGFISEKKGRLNHEKILDASCGADNSH
ncbi:4Fe-4S binding protein [Lutispora sp.]|uniref:4Fe-4S binding protein n=1 Tax=Lutispora sp. TaxID=2828727 RepID=UPI00356305C7